MCDFPENLQIKREPSPPSTPEDKSPSNIKAKLNLHVKRRLQDFNQTAEDNLSFNNKTQIAVDIKQEPQKSETIRQKRPYNKRTDKNKSATQSLESTSLLTAAGSAAALAPQRKYKHKIKQIVGNDNQDLLPNSNTIDEPASVGHNATITAGALSAGEEDEGGHDNELKAGREKEKCPDVLAMVLSMKKRALMQDPEVQKFLKDVMEVIKS
ncbi:uncharacterized protein LOC135954559 [Calliphora vicina]|uniref:uncharacterized protein LOC135954559 n=1 Tax=Calliphora vicina TaxID=7373 RepID=UPI00325AFB02